MALEDLEVVRIDSEQAAWDALNGLLNGKLVASKMRLDLSDLSWTKVRFAFRGRPFHQTVTTSMMSGLVEYQDDIYRSAARLLKDDGRITRLTDQEKRQLELVFSVNNGSSELLAKAAESLGALGTAVEKLSGKQALIAILVFLVLFFGSAGGYVYLSHVKEMKQIEAQEKGREFDLKEQKDLFDFIERMMIDKQDKAASIKKAVRLSSQASDISTYNDHAIEEIIRRSNEATEIDIQDLTLSAEFISEITKSSRAKSEKITIQDLFIVTAVETDDITSYKVHLEHPDGSWNFVANLEDPLVGSRYQKAIQNAEWSHNPVMVHIVGRKVGESIRDAKIVKAYTPRKSKST